MLKPVEVIIDENSIEFADHHSSVFDEQGELQKGADRLINFGALDNSSDLGGSLLANPRIGVPVVDLDHLEPVFLGNFLEVVDVHSNVARLCLPARMGVDPE